ncbi:hypothetical protein AVL61_01110 [Kocuria rosea subsp. polaris]|uniref:Uncharacterized protein n=1 Tax=Kocuria rosea subsp. polaris TaxID=136273 RepID=A0A0W8IMP0_KOCRO|nr:hypothetical protein [Kocuria polaris]KUG61554.1 hypothetical protein AVL61_01110 [Kocuria polaris]
MTVQELIGRGHAVASSSYAGTGWALETAVQDQLDTLAAVQADLVPQTLPAVIERRHTVVEDPGTRLRRSAARR